MKNKEIFKKITCNLVDKNMYLPYSHIWVLTYSYQNPKLNAIQLGELMLEKKHLKSRQTVQNYISHLKKFGIVEYSSLNSPVKINKNYIK